MKPVRRDKCQHLRDKQEKQTKEKIKEGLGKRSRREFKPVEVSRCTCGYFTDIYLIN